MINMEVAIWDDGEDEGDDKIKVQYSEEEIASFRSIFNMFDKKGTGEISMTDFHSIMESL